MDVINQDEFIPYTTRLLLTTGLKKRSANYYCLKHISFIQGYIDSYFKEEIIKHFDAGQDLRPNSGAINFQGFRI